MKEMDEERLMIVAEGENEGKDDGENEEWWWKRVKEVMMVIR